jgi:hypothetical protein
MKANEKRGATIMNMDKVNSQGDTRRRTRDAFTTTAAASQEHKDGNFDALQDTRYVGLYGNTASNRTTRMIETTMQAFHLILT